MRPGARSVPASPPSASASISGSPRGPARSNRLSIKHQVCISVCEQGRLSPCVPEEHNLALAEKQFGKQDLVAPCSACFLNLSKADAYMQEDPPLAEKVNISLAAGGLHYDPGTIKTRHLMHVLEDVTCIRSCNGPA